MVPSFLGSRDREQVQSSRWLENGSYARIKTITLGYSVPRSIVSRANVQNVRAYVTGVNLFTFTNYSGYDPEASTNTDALGGIDMAPYPSSKGFTVGLNITF